MVHLKGARERISWRLLRATVLKQRPHWQWRFIHKTGETVVERTGYSDEDWKHLSNRLDQRPKRRGIEIRMPDDGLED